MTVLGAAGTTPFAGVAWQVLHYVEGLRRTGCDVRYVEDTGTWPYDPAANTVTSDAGYAVRYLEQILSTVGLADAWAYIGPDGLGHGPLSEQLSTVWSRCDVLVNLTGATVLRDEHMTVPIRIYLETDPVRPQVQVACGNRSTIEWLEAHTHHFTYAENFGAPGCGVPLERFRYLPTRPPVVLDWWATERPARPKLRFTTVSNWEQTGKDVEWRGETYFWSKHREFMKVIDLPRRVSPPLELALGSATAGVIDLLHSYGWHVLDGVALSRDIRPYRDYIRGSGAEFTVAKDQNVRLCTGWFSDRSACYLAAGRPVATQNTDFKRVLPTGEGLFAFQTVDDAVAAIEDIRSDYARHSAAAREIGREYFAAEAVVSRLLGACGL